MNLSVLIEALSSSELDELQDLIYIKKNGEKLMEDFYNGKALSVEEFRAKGDEIFGNQNKQ